MLQEDWINGLLGGLLIGLAAAGLLLVNGRIAGISGIVGGLLRPGERAAWAERLAFVTGLVAGAQLLALLWRPIAIEVTPSLPLLLAGGLLVGFGTRLGSGCTSGHGVCGLSRGSPRSLAATATFMIVAALVVALMRHLPGGAP